MQISEPTREDKITKLLLGLKKANQLYNSTTITEKQKAQILEACKKSFDSLEALGLPQTVSETLVIGGADFVKTWANSGVDLGTSNTSEIVFR